MLANLPIVAMTYVIPTLLIGGLYFAVRSRKAEKAAAIRDAAIEEGMTEPSSLHPVINPNRCIGCGLCVGACPENDVLGIIGQKAQLINPAHCIGHGACKAACPVDAMTLVFGTERRGVDIPVVGANFETNVPGVFIAGELGGMGLIRNAITQGAQALEAIRKLDGIGRGEELDVVIVGAGPAGFSASLAAKKHNLRFITVEQGSLGGAVAHYPRGKIVMTAPVDLPMVGKVKLRETTKEALLEFWQGIERQTGLSINYNERVETVTKTDAGFEVQTPRGTYRTRAVLLAIGRHGTPRKLDVPGEDLSKVVYRLIDPEQYRGQNVLVVGGGDSALEAAASVADEPGTIVMLSYRSEAFTRAKAKNRQRVEEAAETGRLGLLMKSNVRSITDTHVHFELEGKAYATENDMVIVAAGGILPTTFLESVGVSVETKHGTL